MKAQYCEVKIETVYHDENKGTHFHPIKDSVRIFSRIFKYLFSSLAAFLTDIILFTALTKLFSAGVIISTVIARIISSAVNFFINKKVVFASNEPYTKTILKYYLPI
jgi:dolichol-phosphate mannosyltransferase